MNGQVQWLLELLVALLFAGFGAWNMLIMRRGDAIQAHADQRVDAATESANRQIEAAQAEIKDLRMKVHAQDGEVNKLNVLVAGSYVTREELRDHLREMTTTVTTRIDKLDTTMRDQMSDIYDELKQKADKS